MNSVPTIVITCGPSYEPIDQVRRLTNFSTGELGMMLAGRLVKGGCRVICFKGAGATTPVQAPGAEIIEFTTNDHLYALIASIEERDSVIAFFHTAALCDFKVKTISGRDSQEFSNGKISSRAGELYLTLTPTLKVIFRLRSLFPGSLIVGWKYEVEGMVSEAIAKGLEQIVNNGTDSCVVNGPAYGAGFGYLTEAGNHDRFRDKSDLCEFLTGKAKCLVESMGKAGG